MVSFTRSSLKIEFPLEDRDVLDSALQSSCLNTLMIASFDLLNAFASKISK